MKKSATLPFSTLPYSLSLPHACATLSARRLNRLHRRQSGFDEHLELRMHAVTRHHVIGIGARVNLAARLGKSADEILQHLVAATNSLRFSGAIFSYLAKKLSVSLRM